MLSSSVGDWGSQESRGIPPPEGLTAILPDSFLLEQHRNKPAPQGMDARGGFGFCSADGVGGAAPG